MLSMSVPSEDRGVSFQKVWVINDLLLFVFTYSRYRQESLKRITCGVLVEVEGVGFRLKEQ